MWAVSWYFAANGTNVACVNAALITTNVFSETILAEDVPVFLDESKDFGAVLNGAVSPFEVSVKFFLMELRIKVNDVVGIPGGRGAFCFRREAPWSLYSNSMPSKTSGARSGSM